jgi:WD40-like Beta Propeller Repeat
MRSRMATGAIAPVVALALASSASATFPGANGRIAFFGHVGCTRYSGPGDPCAAESYRAILTIAPGGGRARPLVRCPGPQCTAPIGETPVWSPDGSLMAVGLIGDDSSPGVAIVTADGALVRRLAVPGSPIAWLPDGRRLAVLDGNRVLVVAVTGGPVRAVSGPQGPRTWSINGDVAIANARGIMVWRAATGRRRLVRAAGERFTFGRPDWSPDGRRLAVTRTGVRTGLATIVSVPAGGGRSRVIVRAPSSGCLGDPVWSPTGTSIAFTSVCLDEASEDAPSVYGVRADGSRLRRWFDPIALTSPYGSLDRYVSRALAWQPRP